MNVETASRLAKLRKKSGLSQEELAEKIGVSRQAVSKWERAESSPDTENLVALARVYDVKIDDMLNLDGAGENGAQTGGKNKPPSSFWMRFPYPVLCTVIFLLLGFLFNAWHPGWLIYLTVPIYYAIIGKEDPNKKLREAKRAEREAKRAARHGETPWED